MPNTPNHPPQAPVLFVSHGAPTFALSPGIVGPQLRALGADWSRQYKAVLLVSPHWQTASLEVMTTAQPRTLHDFGGFPQELYQLQYPAPGAPAVAQQALVLLATAGIPASGNDQRPFDHGAWVVLMQLLPQATLPTFQISLPISYGPEQAYALGRALAPLRAEGIAIIGSGSLTHNLYELSYEKAPPMGYVQSFVDWTQVAVATRQTELLLNYRKQAPYAERAHPTEEHFLPLLTALGASSAQDQFSSLESEILYGAISMQAYAWT